MEATEVTVPARAAVEQLLASGVTHVVWLPDSESGFMYEALTQAEAERRLRLVPICREGEAVPLALGLLLGGKRPAILIQNTGFFESGDSLRGQAIDFGLPLVLLIGYRGWKPDRAAMVDTAGIYLEPVLQAYGVPYYLVDQPAALPRIREAFAEAERRQGPVAVLIAGEWE
jgi:sulfopyruvate decarboxylase TPP-binding subunit